MHTTGFMTMYVVTCRLTAEYGISSVPQHSTYKYGTLLYLTFIISMCVTLRLTFITSTWMASGSVAVLWTALSTCTGSQ